MADKKKSVSQSRTMWVKKGTVVNNKAVKKGYLAQYGKPEKKVTAKVELTRQTGKAAAGATVRYKGGRKVIGKPAPVVRRKPTTMSAAADASTPDKTDKSKKVAVGTIRVGAAGRATNRWNGKRWVRIASEPQRKPVGASVSKPTSQKPTSQKPTSSQGPFASSGLNVTGQRPADTGNKVADAAYAAMKQGKARGAEASRYAALAAAKSKKKTTKWS